jgi:hypothetical protein
MRFCQSLCDSIVQQLLKQSMMLLQGTNYELNEAQYSAREVCSNRFQIHIFCTRPPLTSCWPVRPKASIASAHHPEC